MLETSIYLARKTDIILLNFEKAFSIILFAYLAYINIFLKDKVTILSKYTNIYKYTIY